MHRHLKAREETVGAQSEAGGREVYVGDVIQAALAEGPQVHPVRFDDGAYLDIGTPEDLVQADAFVHNSLPTPLE